MEKKATVKSVNEVYRTPFTWKGETNYPHYIEFNNGDKGEYISHSPTCDKFKVGEEVTYNIEQKTNQSGGTIMKISPQKASGFGSKKTDRDEGVITALSCLSSACTLLHRHNPYATDADAIDIADKFFNWATSKSTKK